MIIIVSSKTNEATIAKHLGQPEYSYHFVLKEFCPVLQQLGTVKHVADPEREVDAIYADAFRRGESCVFLSFSPPHQTILDLVCPTVPIFAWEFDAIPDETWLGERFQDWRFVLNKLGRAITHSGFAVCTVQAAMGLDFPIASIPAPVWDHFAALGPEPCAKSIAREVCMSNASEIFDTRSCDRSSYSSPPPVSAVSSAQRAARLSPGLPLQIDGIVYTSVFCPYDGRKNHFDMLRAFCWVFRDIADATLILKLTHHDNRYAIDVLTYELYKLGPFRCRVILIDAFLDDDDYENLLMATTYAVNTSRGEGQCLPLMEYMSYGTPVIAPCHTGMAEYVCEESAFVIRSTAEPACWPHDPRAAYRTLARRIDFESLTKAYHDSYRVAKEEPDRYAAMAGQARRALKQHCSSEVVLQRLREFLTTPARPIRIDRSYGKIVPREMTYRMGHAVDFTSDLDARRYLVAGWNAIEFGRGVWSNGELAELAFRIKPKPRGSLFLCVNLTPFLAQSHVDLDVDIAANGVALAGWRFYLSRPEDVQHCWRYAVIPTEIASGDEIYISFQIKEPKSPYELGLSDDPRPLGIMLHELSISAIKRGFTGKIRPSAYCLSTPIDFATDPAARRYLITGWSFIELGRGIWSNGPLAEVAFRIEPKVGGSLILRANLTPFLAAPHEQFDVYVAANGAGIAQWRFDLADADGAQHLWREANVPAKVAADGEIYITLQIEHPASQRELGLSDDRRLLGVMLHELSILPGQPREREEEKLALAEQDALQ
jgi:glycosyltransferase involved in cell wall biosynthesis